MTITGTITESDYVAAQFLHMRPRVVFAVIGVLLVGLYLWFVLMRPKPFPIALLVFMVGYFTVYLPWAAKSAYRKYKAISEPVELELREDGLFARNPHAQSVTPWDHIGRWRKGKLMVLLYPTDNLFMIVPSHMFGSPEHYAEFTKALESRLGKAT